MKKELMNLIDKYSKKGHFYTSYPTEANWSKDFSSEDYVSALEDFSKSKEPTGLYAHYPFCNSKCFYCICRADVVANDKKIREFLKYNEREIDMLKKIFDEFEHTPEIKEIHLGGGSPSSMNMDNFQIYLDNISKIVDFSKLEEFTLEIDPRTADKEKLRSYQNSGVNRASFGIQDFNADVQKAVNRIQSFEKIRELLTKDIRRGFKSINFDLICGLPLQTRASFEETIEQVIELSPDRICLYSYVHKPSEYKNQIAINESQIPGLEERLDMTVNASDILISAGYKQIGIDHFAKETDDLGKALSIGGVARNFNGYNPGRVKNLIGIGPSGSGRFSRFYVQNIFFPGDYYAKLSENNFPVSKGYKLNKDDLIRRDVIDMIICNGRLDFAMIEEKYGMDFRKYFEKEIASFKSFVKDKIIEHDKKSIKITKLGKLFIAPVCSLFDKFLTY